MFLVKLLSDHIVSCFSELEVGGTRGIVAIPHRGLCSCTVQKAHRTRNACLAGTLLFPTVVHGIVLSAVNVDALPKPTSTGWDVTPSSCGLASSRRESCPVNGTGILALAVQFFRAK
ncbi:conserved hypothetical protein [Histoplasma capsulatum G186AR]|uniref:Uncharacterized protein n=1 Tax=Ajellomyces capsulatus (strain G186AR / H82 / ATCC MYA-2454 / RMSCC 2432) TaxID=447093 RepID=C0P0Q4_AJECG|nr:uncharacterized protein HCBG_08984 [Histoplasma capsulatum G186AR]EEH02704.1 conserved hypothetical protein [Histoplasma capsulatum G186AR]